MKIRQNEHCIINYPDKEPTKKELQERIIIMEKYFELIIDLGFDYDGLDNVNDLKELIDTLVKFASLGRVANTTESIYLGKDFELNILQEKILRGE